MSERSQKAEVLTLREAAQFLRLTQKQVEELANVGEIPGQRIGNEWRFLKNALTEWLRSCRPKMSNKEVLLKWAGVFAGDETLLPMLDEIYKARGRREVAEEP